MDMGYQIIITAIVVWFAIQLNFKKLMMLIVMILAIAATNWVLVGVSVFGCIMANERE